MVVPVNDYIFLNCPFDEAYEPLLKAMIFAVLGCGYRPICALAVPGNIRLDKILGLIKMCRLGIHDLSRDELDAVTERPRFNMALELGAFISARHFGDAAQQEKNLLIFENEPGQVRDTTSDVGGYDTVAHYNEPENIIREVRKWLDLHVPPEVLLPGPSEIIKHYKDFTSDIPEICRLLKLDPNDLSFNDFVLIAQRWLTKYAPPTAP